MIRIPLIRILIFSSIFLLLTVGAKSQSKSDRFRLNYLDKIPAEVDGCNGLYTYDTVSLENKKYILVTALSEYALINVNGIQIQLRYTGESALDGVNSQAKKIFNAVYQGKNYQVILNTKAEKNAGKAGKESETWRDRGTVEVIVGDRHVKIRVHGISGC